MTRVQVSRDPGSGLVALGLAGHPATVLPTAVRVLDDTVAEVVLGMLDTAIADARRTGSVVAVDLDDLIERAAAADPAEPGRGTGDGAGAGR